LIKEPAFLSLTLSWVEFQVGTGHVARAAKSSDVRGHFEALGYDVKLSRDGFVQIRPAGQVRWQSGQWVRDYMVTDQGQVFLVNVNPSHQPPLRGWSAIVHAILS